MPALWTRSRKTLFASTKWALESESCHLGALVRKAGDLLIQEESGHEVQLILRTLQCACLLRDLLP